MAEDTLSESLQENILILACFHEEQAAFIRNTVPTTLFEGSYKIVAQRAYEYLDRFSAPLGDHILDAFDDIVEGSDARKGRAFTDMLLRLYESRATVNPEYILSRVSAFIETQRLKTAIIGAAEALQNGPDGVERAKELLAGVEPVTDVFDVGLFLSDPMSLGFLDQIDASFSTGIATLDRHHLGPRRKTLHLFVALPNRGKSWWLIQLGKRAALRREKVLHVTLEMSALETVQRYFQSIFGLPKRAARLAVTRFQMDDEHLRSLDTYEWTAERTLADDNIGSYLRERQIAYARRLFPNILVKEFPTGQLTVRALEGYLDMLEKAHGFRPDLLLLDYTDLMHTSSETLRLDLGQITKDLRGLAVRRDLALATASQSNRAGVGKKIIDDSNVAEDYSKIGTADTVITYSQTKAEYPHGLARLFVAKARGEQAQQRVLVSQSYATGQFSITDIPLDDSSYQVALSQLQGTGDE